MAFKPQLITFNGRSLIPGQWAKETGIPLTTILARINALGWTVEKALTTPVDRRFGRNAGRRRLGEVRPCPRMLRNPSRDAAYAQWRASGKRRMIHFGRWASAEASRSYRKFAAEWAAGVYEPEPVGPNSILVGEVIIRWIAYCERTYRKRDKPTSEVACNRAALAFVADLYGDEPAAAFGPKRLRTVRELMIKKGWARNTINSQIARIVRAWSWAVGEELVAAAVADALKHVEGLAAGRTTAPEAVPRKPVPVDDVEAVLPHLHAKPARRALFEAMIRYQMLTGMRSGEMCSMGLKDLNRSGPAWRFEVIEHNKTRHLDKPRTIWIGPKAQAILMPYIEAAGDGEPIFMLPPARKGATRTAITVQVYRNIIAAACKTAGVPLWTPHQLRHNRATDVMRLYEDDKAVGAAIGDTPEVARQVYADCPGDPVAMRIAMATG